MEFETSKNIGGIGAILLIIGPLVSLVSAWAGLLGIVGIIMVLIAMKGLADHYNEGGIFNNALYGFITTIVGGVAFVGALVISVLMALTTILPADADWTNPDEWVKIFTEGFMDPSTIFTLIGSIVAALIVLFVVIVIASLFYRKSFNLLASKSGVGMFGTAGIVLLIGAILSIILIGIIVIWIAFILLAVAFFSLKHTAESPQTPETPPSST